MFHIRRQLLYHQHISYRPHTSSRRPLDGFITLITLLRKRWLTFRHHNCGTRFLSFSAISGIATDTAWTRMQQPALGHMPGDNVIQELTPSQKGGPSWTLSHVSAILIACVIDMPSLRPIHKQYDHQVLTVWITHHSQHQLPAQLYCHTDGSTCITAAVSSRSNPDYRLQLATLHFNALGVANSAGVWHC